MSKEMILSNPLLWYLIFSKDCLLFAIFFHVSLGQKINIKRLAVFSFVLGFLVTGIRVVFPVSSWFFIVSLLFILGCKFIFKFDFFKSIISVFFVSVAMIICEFVCMLFFSQLCIPKERFLCDTQLVIQGNILSSLVLLVIIFFIYYAKIKILYVEDIVRKRNLGILLNILITAFIILPNSIFYYFSSYDIPKNIIIFNIISMFVFFSLSTYNTYKSNELEMKKNELEYQKLYNKSLNDLLDGLRTFKHDYANVLNSIQGYMTLNDLKGLKKYFSEILDDYRSVNNLSAVSPAIINNPSVYGLIMSKLYLADSKGIKMQIDITTELNHSEMKIYELCKIIGILLDNAIEASLQSEEKLVRLTIRLDRRENCYVIIVENTFIGEVKINEIFNKGFSSKGKDRGLGLWEVKNITNKCKHVNLRTSINNNIFRQELYIEALLQKEAI